MTKKIIFLFIPLGILLMASRCSRTVHSVKDIPRTEFFDSCRAEPFVDFGKIITLGDQANRFFISLPYSWDIREVYSDTLYGIFGSNFLSIPKKDNEKMSLGITAYSSDKNLKAYYQDELKALVSDDQTRVLETGKTFLLEEEAYWVKFKSVYHDKAVFQFVLYLKKQNTPEIFLVQATAYNPDNYDAVLCNLKRLMDRVEWGG